MSWNRIIGQQRVKKLLRASFESDRLPHALLFTGMEGTGKEAVAIELARTVNCESKSWDACGVCASCRAIASLQHPLVKLVFALPRGKSEAGGDDPYEKLDADTMEAVREQLALKAANPYHTIRIPRASEIKINSVRSINHDSFFRASTGRPIVIISEAERLNAEASNSLLKTLEEPSGSMILILTTSKREALLPTILSRCQQMRFDPLDENDIVAALESELGEANDACRVAAKLANGSYGRALALIEEGAIAERDSIVNYMRAVMQQDPIAIAKAIQPLTEDNDRNAVIQFLKTVAWWFHDIHALREGAAEKIVNVDLVVPLQKFADHYLDSRPEMAIRAIERAIEMTQKNVHLALVLIHLSHSLFDATHSPEGRPA